MNFNKKYTIVVISEGKKKYFNFFNFAGGFGSIRAMLPMCRGICGGICPNLGKSPI